MAKSVDMEEFVDNYDPKDLIPDGVKVLVENPEIEIEVQDMLDEEEEVCAGYDPELDDED